MLIKNPKNSKQYDLHFIVFDDPESNSLLNLDTCERMNLVKVNEEFEELDAVGVLRKVQEDYGDVFDAKQPGKLPGNITSPSTQASSQWSCQADELQFRSERSLGTSLTDSSLWKLSHRSTNRLHG